ncbi:hypothetical protein ACFV1L_11450 [Kitasatospora sp. NPDC059646]|uniref:hypothetical protein n=1 Tax=Kitasatospora sp. NPDC059646 TaxID=3346893 RepID=UPI003678768A
MTALLAANAVVALLGAGAGVAGAVRPGLVLAANEPIAAGTQLYARAYAARAVPLGIATALVLAAGPWSAARPMLTVAGLAQLGDSAIGLRERNPGMAIGAGAAAALHLATACWAAR